VDCALSRGMRVHSHNPNFIATATDEIKLSRSKQYYIKVFIVPQARV
jgi:hypothetical protein